MTSLLLTSAVQLGAFPFGLMSTLKRVGVYSSRNHPTYLPTHLATYVQTYLPSHLPTYLPACLPACQPII